MAYARAGKEAEARALIEERLAANPRDPDALRLKAALRLAERDLEGSIALLEEAIAAAPEQPKGYLALARVKGATEGVAAAREALERGIERTDSTGLRMAMATVEEQTGNTEGAIEQYRVVLARQPGFDVAANNLASLLTDNDPTPEELDEAFRAAKRLRGAELPQFKDTYGWILHLRGDSEAALPVLEEAAEGLPEHPVVQYHLGVVLAELGESARARAALERAIAAAGETPLPQADKARALLDSLPAGE